TVGNAAPRGSHPRPPRTAAPEAAPSGPLDGGEAFEHLFKKYSILLSPRAFRLRGGYRVRAPKLPFSEREVVTNGPGTPQPSRNRLANIFTDIQFWVPVAVLVAGLLLLEWIR